VALFGVVALLVGIGTAYLICAHPEGLNPSWPIGMALLAPAVFALGGLHMVATGLGYSRFSGVLFGAIALCFLAILNWAAFFTSHFHCVETVSFFGVAILRRQPTEIECREQFRAIAAFVDTVVLLPSIVFTWRRLRDRRSTPK
jgi:hypothetical protein